MQKPGDTVSLTASRSGFIRVFDVQLAQSPAVKYSLERKEKQSEQEVLLLKNWLNPLP
ncbi:MAG: hypothetical protein JNL88_01675 [Bacteroidia bacterium]|nr:hypothetical protein [Bacteroidia bacterium]